MHGTALQEALSLEAVLLKPQMCIPGSEYTAAKAEPSEVAQHTLSIMRRQAFQSYQTTSNPGSAAMQQQFMQMQMHHVAVHM